MLNEWKCDITHYAVSVCSSFKEWMMMRRRRRRRITLVGVYPSRINL
jgi:hypothetical protein